MRFGKLFQKKIVRQTTPYESNCTNGDTFNLMYDGNYTVTVSMFFVFYLKKNHNAPVSQAN